jgi:hypothetical protein
VKGRRSGRRAPGQGNMPHTRGLTQWTIEKGDVAQVRYTGQSQKYIQNANDSALCMQQAIQYIARRKGGGRSSLSSKMVVKLADPQIVKSV